MQDNKSKSAAVIIAAIVVVLIGIAAATYALIQAASNSREAADTTKTTETTSPEVDTSTEPKARPPVIVFTDKGFSQVTYMFPAGTEITVDNQSSMDMQFSSADHPTHRKHPELNMQVLGAGESGTFTPPAGRGTYGFHDHINDQFEGTLIME